MKQKQGFLLLPGGGMSSWVWEKLIPLLDAPAITPAYRLAVNNAERRKNATIRDCVNYHKQLIEESHLDAVVIVSHSGAGALAAAIAKAIPGKIMLAVYLSANIPKNHTTTLDALPFILKLINKHAIKSQVNIDAIPLKSKRKMVMRYFCNRCDAQTSAFILEHDMLPEPLCLAFEKYDFDDFPLIRQIFVVLKDDKTITVKGQQKMMENLNITEKREIDSDHLVMLSKPGELAAILNELIKDT